MKGISKELHSISRGGYFGPLKILEIVQQHFYSKKSRDEVEKRCHDFVACAANTCVCKFVGNNRVVATNFCYVVNFQ